MLFLFFFGFSLAHDCVHHLHERYLDLHPEIEAGMRSSNATPSHLVPPMLLRKRMLGNVDPIRVKLDFRYMEGGNDPNLCTSVGQRVKLGDPKDNKQCEKGCSLNQNGCNCILECTDIDVLTPDKKAYLQNSLFKKAKEFLENVLSVKRTPLTLDQDNCACGAEKLPTDVVAKEGEFAGRSARDSYQNNGQYDMVLFVTTHTNRFYHGDTLASACFCQSNDDGRPTFGHINWGADKIDADPSKFNEQLGVALHEMTHALGFTNKKIDDFIGPRIGTQLRKTLSNIYTTNTGWNLNETNRICHHTSCETRSKKTFWM